MNRTQEPAYWNHSTTACYHFRKKAAGGESLGRNIGTGLGSIPLLTSQTTQNESAVVMNKTTRKHTHIHRYIPTLHCMAALNEDTASMKYSRISITRIIDNDACNTMTITTMKILRTTLEAAPTMTSTTIMKMNTGNFGTSVLLIQTFMIYSPKRKKWQRPHENGRKNYYPP